MTTKKAALGTVVGIRAAAVDVVEIELSEPFNGLLVNLNVGIVPKGAKSDFARNPIGTGPYKLRSYHQDGEALLESNAEYFDGPPRTRYLRIRMISGCNDSGIRTEERFAGSGHGTGHCSSRSLPCVEKTASSKDDSLPRKQLRLSWFSFERSGFEESESAAGDRLRHQP